MARYIDADELLNRLPNDLPYKASVKRVLIQAPEADVVPKSEVREIFEEIERLSKILQADYRRDNSETAHLVKYATDYFLYELKKKYTEVDDAGK